ncbi:hypothetical protein FHG64_18010 [Antarcticibacterium flavum]|uniref:Tissue inhibitor of metalloproteinase n=1 Tax=Antarcticibacterium flavum TaxID=2058175 RepID=A0A5B7X6W9_9FLAO|nr:MULTISPECIES: hypothetical protein [Antarcticibacterium]MCM4160917.1 hypothetical protein [Antarcticibacterium sp. W02-3]QCY71139.1 hypothetical protein FHG64_18010 [Antarcticibacterium flavum]
MKIMLTIILSLVSVFGYSCSCKDWFDTSVLERINQTDQIFEGIVNEVTTLDDKTLTIEFLLKRKIKGVDSLDVIVIQTSSGMCGSEFKQGENWLIFSNSNYTGVCSGNFQLFQNSFSEFPVSKASEKYKFYISKLQKFLNELSDLKTQREFVELDKNDMIIAKGEIGADKNPVNGWFYKNSVIKN